MVSPVLQVLHSSTWDEMISTESSMDTLRAPASPKTSSITQMVIVHNHKLHTHSSEQSQFQDLTPSTSQNYKRRLKQQLASNLSPPQCVCVHTVPFGVQKLQISGSVEQRDLEKSKNLLLGISENCCSCKSSYYLMCVMNDRTDFWCILIM